MEMMNNAKAGNAKDERTPKQVKKAEQAKAYKAKCAAVKEERAKIAKETLEYIQANKIKLPDSAIDMLTKLSRPNDRTAISGTFFEKVFGGAPKVGDKVTLRDYLQSTYESKHKLDGYVKQWAAKGIVIKFTENASAPLDSTYVIEKLPF